jgi:transposase
MTKTTHTTTTLRPTPSIIERLVLQCKEGQTVNHIAKTLFLAISTAYFWVKRFTNEGPEKTTYKQRGRPVGSGKKLTPENELLIMDLIATPNQPLDYGLNFSTWTRKAIAELIKQQFQIEIAERTIGDYLRSWSYTSQKAVKVAYQRDPEKVEEWVNVTFPAIKESAQELNADIFFCDESSIQTESFNLRSYSRKGRKPVVPQTGSRLKVNIVSAISANGSMRFKTYDQSMDGNLFINFMDQLIKAARGSMVFLIVDNLKTHHSKMVTAFINDHSDKIRIFYLPPYCPELNPDEYLNNIIKLRFRSQPQVKTKDELSSKTVDILSELKRDRKLIKRIFLKEEIQYISN